jgi:hypothetical protein
MHTTMTTKQTGLIHLSLLGQDPVSEGRFGCDYAWNADCTSYRCLPNRWMPGSDESWAMNEAGYYDEMEEGGEEPFVATESVVTTAPAVDDEIWF